MITLCWAAKGGSGTTVAVAGLGLTSSEPTLLVDLSGDLPSALGITHLGAAGVGDWLRSDVPAERLRSLEVEARPGLDILACGTEAPRDSPRYGDLADWLTHQHRRVIIDAGTGEPPTDLVRNASTRWLVTRPCYLALNAADRQQTEPHGVVLVDEIGRALRPSAIEAALGAPVVIELIHDPAVARAVDAGLLASRLPRGFRRRLAQSLERAA